MLVQKKLNGGKEASIHPFLAGIVGGYYIFGENNNINQQWPVKGGIEARDLEIKYAAELDPVLRGISFSVKPQEKIGVVGRTGSGKSTLAPSFFKFVEASQGSIVIDDIDIKDLGTEDLRSNLTIIPQDPTLFSGTLRSNMDPFDNFGDEDIFTALRRVHLLSNEDEASTSNIHWQVTQL